MAAEKVYGPYEALILGAELEDAGRNFYNRVANSCASAEVREVFKELAEAALDQERLIREELEPAYMPDWYSEDNKRMMSEYLKTVEHQPVFPDPEDTPACDMVAVDPKQALEVGIKAKMQVADYYKVLGDATRDEKGREVFESLKKKAEIALKKLEDMKGKM